MQSVNYTRKLREAHPCWHCGDVDVHKFIRSTNTTYLLECRNCRNYFELYKTRPTKYKTKSS